jgi:hypothetical protein
MQIANLGADAQALPIFIAATVCATVSTTLVGGTEANFLRQALRMLRELRATATVTAAS